MKFDEAIQEILNESNPYMATYNTTSFSDYKQMKMLLDKNNIPYEEFIDRKQSNYNFEIKGDGNYRKAEKLWNKAGIGGFSIRYED